MTIRILGIDPGSRITGFAVLESHNRLYKAECCNVIRLTGENDPFIRLKILYSSISDIISQYKPDICAIETPVYGNDPSAMLKLGRAQAAIIMSVLHQDIPLFEYYPKAVKKSITGVGNASKKQVAFMLKKLISLPDHELTDDATDALAVAWCHIQKLREPGKVSESEQPPSYQRRNTWRSFVDSNPDRIRNP